MYHELPSGASLRSAIRFNGASVFQRRKDMHWTPNIHSRLRFNGASVFQRRKGERHAADRHAAERASMGPPSFNGGRKRTGGR